MQAVNQSYEVSLHQGLIAESRLFWSTFATKDQKVRPRASELADNTLGIPHFSSTTGPNMDTLQSLTCLHCLRLSQEGMSAFVEKRNADFKDC